MRKTYSDIRAEAQRLANETGRDYGIEHNPVFREYRCFMLPAPQYRCGHELQCEVVRPEHPPAGYSWASR